jgi:hypothetical protein
MLTSNHRHAVIRRRGPFAFDYCVARYPFTHCEPRSHGGVVWVEACKCGAERRRSISGLATEYSAWEAKQ